MGVALSLNYMFNEDITLIYLSFDNNYIDILNTMQITYLIIFIYNAVEMLTLILQGL